MTDCDVPADSGIALVTGIVVTFNPDLSVLENNLQPLIGRLSDLVISDNSTDSLIADSVRAWARGAGVTYLKNDGNIGIAEAQNRAVMHAVSLRAPFIIFLDDDSGISANAIEELLRVFREASGCDPSVVAAGPLIIDQRSNDVLAFGWRRRRLTKIQRPVSTAPVDVPFMLSSGTLTSIVGFQLVGEFRDDYFIDHVDLEWGLRATAAGFRMVVVPTAIMIHELGDSVGAVGGNGKHQYAHTNHVRDYYLARNLIFVIGDTGMHPLNATFLLARLFFDICRTIVGSGARFEKVSYQVRGVVDGLMGRRGEYRPAHPR